MPEGGLELVVFTRDLRLVDNPAIMAAGENAVPVFVADPAIERLHGCANRQAFLAESLQDLDRGLKKVGTSLVYRRGPVQRTVAGLVDECGAKAIHLAADASGYAQYRTAKLRARLSIPVVEHQSLTVVDPATVRTGQGTAYRVFSPFHRRWTQVARRPEHDAPTRIAPHGLASDEIVPVETGTSSERQKGGESVAIERLDAFLKGASRYADDRQVPASSATSRLSADLHFGTISPLVVANAADDAGAEEFSRQVAWRDFNHQLLLERPELVRSDLRPTERRWAEAPEAVERWQSGSTGYPIVDAAMRQLIATGWMHNRARMVTASFLTKHLQADWRIGADWFMRWLTDGDIANNSLGWQWVAGTGTDTNPWRMLNPTLQSRKYDPHGEYIRRWVPELADLTDDEIHEPGPLSRASTGYPEPIVDHRSAYASFRGTARPPE